MSWLLAFSPAALTYVTASNVHYVGVKDIFLETNKAPIRVYYPATKPENPEPVKIFRDATNFVKGYMWSFTPGRPFLYGAISLFTSLSTFAIPTRYAELPTTSRNATPVGEKLPLVIFSHGLTGTGEENSMLLASIASHGFVVASIHHTDGSSCVVTDGAGQVLWYKHPDPENYSINFREEQLNHRVKEMMDVKIMMLNHSELGSRIDDTNIFACGFSYGAATAVLATVRNPKDFVACVAIDGWFLIQAYEVNTEFPLDVIKAESLPVPTFFLNSSSFMKNGNGVIAKRMAEASVNHRHEVYGTGSTHMLFVDLKSWFPGFMWNQLKKLKMQGEESEPLTEKFTSDIIKWLMLRSNGEPAI